MPNIPSNVIVPASAAVLAEEIGSFIVAAVIASLARHGKFVVALSGGSLPKVLGQALQAAVTSGAELHTDKWHVFYADERIVPLTDADSNHLACKAAVYDQPWFKTPSAQLHPINPSLSPKDCAADYEAQVIEVLGGSSSIGADGSATAGLPQFDLVLLGMGPDGHTASLFPDHPLLNEASRIVAEITDSPKPPPQRVTLTLPVINHAVQVAFVATGESKAPVLKQIFDASVPYERSLPSARVRQRDTEPPTWFTDAPAMSQL